MDTEIKKLSSDLLEDYLHFFETDAHADNPDEDRCYCVCWCSADHRADTDFSTPEKRRSLAINYVNNGTIQGYLAYYNGKVVGWCNANEKSKCLNCISRLRFMTNVIVENNKNEKVKSIFCFTIAPNMKRKGVATKLLERVCSDAKSEGYDCIEAYPNNNFINEFRDFMGPFELYKKFDFVAEKEIENTIVMRKSLNEQNEHNSKRYQLSAISHYV